MSKDLSPESVSSLKKEGERERRRAKKERKNPRGSNKKKKEKKHDTSTGTFSFLAGEVYDPARHGFGHEKTESSRTRQKKDSIFFNLLQHWKENK